MTQPMQKMEIPALHPNMCIRCRVDGSRKEDGSPGREFFIDLGVTLEWEGVAYLCSGCVADLVKEVGGYKTQAEVNAIIAAQGEFLGRAIELAAHRDDFYTWMFNTAGIDLEEAEKKYVGISRADAAAADDVHGESTDADGSLVEQV